MLAIGGVFNGGIKYSIFKDRSCLTRLASTTANYFIRSLRTFDGKSRDVAINFQIQPIFCRRKLDCYDIPNATNAIKKVLNDITLQIHSEELACLKDIKKDTNRQMKTPLFELGLEGRVKELIFYKEV